MGSVHRFVLGKPRGYYSLVAARSTLPAVSRRGARPSWRKAALALLLIWRQRLSALHEDGWVREQVTVLPSARDPELPVLRKLLYLLNCPPSACSVSPLSRPCRHTSLCPHCWGRSAADTWSAMDARLFPGVRKANAAKATQPPRRGRISTFERPKRVAPSLQDLTLIRRRLRVVVPMRDAERERTLPVLLDRRLKEKAHDDRKDLGPGFIALRSRTADLRALRRAGALGGLEVDQVRLRRVKGDGFWILDIRQLLFVKTAELSTFLSSAAFSNPLLDSTVFTHENPTRKQVALSTAWAYSYPRYLLFGQLFVVTAVLADREGRRMTTRFGNCFGT